MEHDMASGQEGIVAAVLVLINVLGNMLGGKGYQLIFLTEHRLFLGLNILNDRLREDFTAAMSSSSVMVTSVLEALETNSFALACKLILSIFRRI